jgi:hypothetical protein
MKSDTTNLTIAPVQVIGIYKYFDIYVFTHKDKNFTGLIKLSELSTGCLCVRSNSEQTCFDLLLKVKEKKLIEKIEYTIKIMKEKNFKKIPVNELTKNIKIMAEVIE